MADEDWDRWTPPASPFRSFDEDEDENSLLPEDNGWIDRWIDDSPSAGTPNSGLSPPASCDAALQPGDTIVQAEYTIETVTIVTGINKRINLARLCDAKPHIFGVRSQACVASPPEKSSKAAFKNGSYFLVSKGHDGRPFAGIIYSNGKIQITSISTLEAVSPCIEQVVALLQEAHALSSAAAPVILDNVPAEPLVCVQTELTLRLGLQLPFHVNYDRVHGLFFNGRLFEQPGANVTVIETRSAHECGSGPFFRIERNDFTNPSFRASFVIFKNGKIQARCSKISADVTAMQAACSSVLAILHENRSQIEATPNPAGRGKTSPPPAAPSSTQRRTATALRYPKALHVVTVKLPRDMTSGFYPLDQVYTDCAENCLLRFIQIALIDCGGDGRAINSARARELGATVEISEYFSRWPVAFSQNEYETEQFQARCKWAQLTCLRPPPCAYVRPRGGFEMQAGATNFLAVLQSMFPRMNVPPACMMRNCSKEQLSQHILRFKNIETFGPTSVLRSNPPHSNWVHPVLQPQLCPHSSAMDWQCNAVLHINDAAVLKFVWWDRNYPHEGLHEPVDSGHAQLYDV